MDSIYIHFDGLSLKEANIKAADLRNEILRKVDTDVPLLKANENTQDAGSILEIILASKAVVELAKAVSLWLLRNNNVKILFKDKDKNVISIDNLNSKDEHLYEFLKNFKK